MVLRVAGEETVKLLEMVEDGGVNVDLYIETKGTRD